MNVRIFALGAALASVPIGGAFATPLTAIDILQQFNAVITGNVSTPSDIEGRTVVGGNLTGGATFFNNPGAAAPSAFRALTVYGSSTVGTPINVNNGGGATIAGSAAGLINANGGGVVSVANPATAAPSPLPGFAATFAAPLTALSAALAALPANSAFPTNAVPGWPNNVPITASAGTGLGVFNLTAAELAGPASFSVNLNGRGAVVFNVSGGGTINLAANYVGGGLAIARDVIWNFTQATSVSFGTQWFGTVLAPLATVTNNTPIEGMLFAAAYNGTGELHSQPFRQGTLLPGLAPGPTPVPTPEPTPTPVPGPTPVPVPGAGLLFAAGLLGLLGASRRARFRPAA